MYTIYLIILVGIAIDTKAANLLMYPTGSDKKAIQGVGGLLPAQDRISYAGRFIPCKLASSVIIHSIFISALVRVSCVITLLQLYKDVMLPATRYGIRKRWKILISHVLATCANHVRG